MSRVFVLMFLLVALAYPACAENWYPGFITLKNGKTFRGEVATQFAYDVALFRIGTDVSDVTVFPAFKVDSFGFYDPSDETQKEFVSIQFSDGAATSYRFFERLVSGEYSILRRQMSAWYSIHLDIPEYDYYIASASGDFLPIEKFKRKIYPQLLEASKGALREYVRSNRLNPSRLLDSILIVRHYNLLQAGDPALAKN